MFFYPVNDQAPQEDRRAATSRGAELARRAGWRIVKEDENVLIIEDEQDVAPDTVNQRSLWANALAETVDLVFDGWECMVLTEEDAPDAPPES